MELLKGKPVVDTIDKDIINRVNSLKEKDIYPQLAIIRIGENTDDVAYEKNIRKKCFKLGIDCNQYLFPIDCSEHQLLETIANLNQDNTIHGILLFRPLPKHINEERICRAISPDKDIDGISPASMAAVYSGKEGFYPCTAQAVLELLDYYNIPIEGKKVSVIGRSLVIGRPVAMMLMQRNATVTICHSKTKDMEKDTYDADIVIAAIGKAEYLGKEYFYEDQTVIDVGINFSNEKQKLVGDVDISSLEDTNIKISPVPGGVGGITTSVLIKHVVEACEHY
jgi:methylenetetrahydrofolate dehydrogenase (NADP+)/methenyltetrahydrofolate cyclohydrolase